MDWYLVIIDNKYLFTKHGEFIFFKFQLTPDPLNTNKIEPYFYYFSVITMT